jgi:hypothetical protein
MPGCSEIKERLDGMAESWDIKNYMPGLSSLGGKDSTELESFYENGSERDKKNANLQSLQLAVDSVIDGEITEEKYREVKANAVRQVGSFYLGQSVDEILTPDTQATTRRSGLPGDEPVIEKWAENLDYEGVGRVVAVASGGLEPGIVASSVLDAELDVVRYSKNDHGDTEVIDVDTGYEDSSVLVVDDNSFSGETLQEVEDHVSEKASQTYSDAVVEGRYSSELKAMIPQLTHRRWKYRNDEDNCPIK